MLYILWGSEVCFPCVLQVGHLIKFVWFWWSREWDEPLFDDPSNCEIEFYIHSANFFGNLFRENKKSLSFCESLFAVLLNLGRSVNFFTVNLTFLCKECTLFYLFVGIYKLTSSNIKCFFGIQIVQRCDFY